MSRVTSFHGPVERRGLGRGTARAPGKAEIAQNNINGRAVETHQPKLRATECETQATSPKWMSSVLSGTVQWGLSLIAQKKKALSDQFTGRFLLK